MKEQALAKMEELRSEIQLLQGQDMTSMNIWRDKVAQMKEIAQGYQAQNALLQESLSLAQRRAEENQAHQQQDQLSDQATRNLNFGGAPKKQYSASLQPAGSLAGFIRRVETDANIGEQAHQSPTSNGRAAMPFTSKNQVPIFSSNAASNATLAYNSTGLGSVSGDVTVTRSNKGHQIRLKKNLDQSITVYADKSPLNRQDDEMQYTTSEW